MYEEKVDPSLLTALYVVDRGDDAGSSSSPGTRDRLELCSELARRLGWQHEPALVFVEVEGQSHQFSTMLRLLLAGRFSNVVAWSFGDLCVVPIDYLVLHGLRSRGLNFVEVESYVSGPLPMPWSGRKARLRPASMSRLASVMGAARDGRLPTSRGPLKFDPSNFEDPEVKAVVPDNVLAYFQTWSQFRSLPERPEGLVPSRAEAISMIESGPHASALLGSGSEVRRGQVREALYLAAGMRLPEEMEARGVELRDPVFVERAAVALESGLLRKLDLHHGPAYQEWDNPFPGYRGDLDRWTSPSSMFCAMCSRFCYPVEDHGKFVYVRDHAPGPDPGPVRGMLCNGCNTAMSRYDRELRSDLYPSRHQPEAPALSPAVLDRMRAWARGEAQYAHVGFVEDKSLGWATYFQRPAVLAVDTEGESSR